MQALLNKYLSEVSSKKSPRSFKDNLSQATALSMFFGSMRPKSVRPKHVAQFLDCRGAHAKVRANREKALLSHVFTMAMRWGVVDMNPCRGVAGHVEKPRTRYVTDAEFAAVRNEAGLFITDMMDLAYATGQRASDLLNIRIEDFCYDTSDRMLLQVTQQKTGSKVAIEANLRVVKIYQDRATLPKRSGGHLFVNLYGRPYSYFGFSCMFRRARDRALASGTLKESFTFHDIRAKALTDAKLQGQDAQQIAGHRTPEQTAEYIRRREHQVVRAVGVVA
jgi:integrase